MDLRERLLLFIDFLNIEKARFEKEVGLSNGFVDKASNNTRRSSLNRISNRYPQLNIDWLLTGKGEMIKPGDINVVGDGNVSNTGLIDGNISVSVKKGGGEESYILTDGSDEFVIPAGLPKESYQKIMQMLARIKRLEEENDQLKKDKAILQEFVTFLQHNGKKK